MSVFASLHRYRPGRRGVVTAVAAVAILLSAWLVMPFAGALGFFGPRTYLLLSENSNELRAIGGFVGVYGSLVLERGHIVSLDYGDGKDFDYVYADHLPDGQFVSTLRDEGEPVDFNRIIHGIHDDRYSVDFPTAARSFAAGYEAMFDDRPATVIGFTPVAASGLVRLVGPLSVPGEPVQVTESNLLELIYKHTQNFGDGEDDTYDRKQFVYDLGKTLAAKLLALPPTRWPAIAQALVQAADERDIQLYFADSRIQHLIHDQGWDGAYPPPSDDFLAVVDSNEINGAKANLVTDEALTYHVALAPDGGAVATLKIDYVNRGTRNLSFSTRDMPYLDRPTYEARVRIYAPLGSQRLSPGSGTDPEPEFGRTVFEEWVSVPSESTDSLTLHYHLPPSRIEGRQMRYDLFVRKQPGTGALPLNVAVTGPNGWQARGAGDREWATQTNLEVDRRFTVTFEQVDGSR